MNIDPLALYGAALATVVFAIQLYREFRDQPRLAALVQCDWPEFAPNKSSDLGGDPGPMYVRPEITNVGRRPVTLRAAGLSMKLTDAKPHGLRERVLFSVPGYRMDRFRVPFTTRGTHENQTLDEGQSWVLQRKADDVAWDVADQTAGHMIINGAYAERSTGLRHFWSSRSVVRGLNVLELGQPPWTMPFYNLDNPPTDDPHAEKSKPSTSD